MQQENTGTRVGGIWLAIASVLLIVALAVHGPIAPELVDQMARISHRTAAWSVAHWLAAAALSCYAVAGLIILASRSSLTGGPWRMSAWALLIIGGLWTLNTAVAEATVITDAARSGNSDVFEAWWAYAEGKANGFSFLVLALAVIAGSDARNAPGATPSWAAWAAMVAGIASFTGWALGMWLDVAIGSLLWITSSILISAWTVWFGVALARSPGALPSVRPPTHAGYQTA